jgi:hypothetical protein
MAATLAVGILPISDQIRLAMRNVVNNPRPVILVQCLTCQHRGFVSERELVRFGIKPGTPVAQFVKRLRCRKCGGGSVMARRSTSKSAVA